jgi:D-3-phosphoglycerate dehydrogenase
LRKAVIIEPGYQQTVAEEAVLGPLGLNLERLVWQGDRNVLRAGVADAEVIFVRDTVLDSADVAAMHRARGIVRYGIGVDSIDLDAARARGIKVANVREYGADIEVADHTLALFLALRRRIVSRDRAVREGAWQIGQAEPVGRISGSTLGIVGFGRIGRAVQKRFAAFGVTDVLVSDPYVSDEQARAAGVEVVPLDELAARSDIITIHAPATAGNRHLIGAAFLSRVRRGAMLINTARGSLIDEDALVHALQQEWIWGAGLDVFENEPPHGSMLLRLPNVVVSDHTAWYSEATVSAIQAAAAEQARQILLGLEPANWVNP